MAQQTLDVTRGREQGWKTITGKYDRSDHRTTTKPVALYSYGGLDEVPDLAKAKVLDRNERFLKVRRHAGTG
jgi:hypothetical protein